MLPKFPREDQLPTSVQVVLYYFDPYVWFMSEFMIKKARDLESEKRYEEAPLEAITNICQEI